jgi:hypothetical protein
MPMSRILDIISFHLRKLIKSINFADIGRHSPISLIILKPNN